MNNGVQQQVGLEGYILVRASSAITDGQVVMFTGAVGDQLTGAPANAASSGFKAGYILGVATQNIAFNDVGYVTLFGQCHGLNTVAWNLGDMLWYDPTSTTGALTNTQPVDPNFQIQVGYVTRKSAIDGHIQVRVDALTSLTNLTNVNITSPVLGEALIYGGANVWVNGNIEQANIANTANSVAGANVTGQVANALIAGTVYTNSQPNITSVGSLTGLTVSNATGVVNFTTTSNVTLGAVGNLHITGGTTGQVLSTNGSGNLSWITPSGGGGTPAGSNTQIQYNNSGSFGASNNLSFTNTSGSANLQLGAIDANSAIVTFTANNNLGGTKVAYIKKFGGVTGSTGLFINEDTKISVFTPVLDASTISNISLGDVANVHITGGTSGQILSTDGGGTLSWIDATTTSPGGSNTELQFNNSGSFGGISTVTYDGSTLSLGSVSDINITGGTTGQVLTTDGAGNLSWTTASGGSSTTDFTPSFLLGGM